VSRTSSSFRYDPNLGDPRAEYRRADKVHVDSGQPEVPGIFVVDVVGESMLSTMYGRQSVAWETPRGSPCIILGYWTDDTVHLRWPAINGTYRIDGRLPSWVVERDRDAKMAGGGRVLRASSPPIPAPDMPQRVILGVVAAVVILALILGFVVIHGALGA
jgi:hypothetical protein